MNAPATDRHQPTATARAQLRAAVRGLLTAPTASIPAAIDDVLQATTAALGGVNTWVGQFVGTDLVLVAHTDQLLRRSEPVPMLGQVPGLELWLDGDEPVDIDLIRLGRRVTAAADIVRSSDLRRCLVAPGRWAERSGVLGLDGDRPTPWTAEEVAELRHVADLVLASLDRHETAARQERERAELERVQAWELLLRKVSNRFATSKASIADPAGLETMLFRTLADVREALGADRAIVWIDHLGDGLLRPRHEETAPGVAHIGASRPSLHAAELDGAWPSGVVAHVSADEPDTALHELVQLPSAPPLGYLVMVRVPISSDRSGLLTFASETAGWRPPPDTDEIMQAVTEIISAALARAEFEQRLAHQAHHDQLTGLPNRFLFADRIEVALRAAARTRHHVGVLFLNIDHFKDVNDVLGHASGDAVLAAVGRRLASVCRSSETLARLSGDEYAVVATGASGLEVEALSERIQQALSAPFSVNGYEIAVSASTGVAVVGPQEAASVDAAAMVRRAEIAMHEAKRSGPASARSFDAAMEHRMMDRITLHRQLRAAVRPPTELGVWYQPLVSLPERRLVGLEALVRWHHPERGLLLPGTFIEIAEDSGLIGEVGLIVLDQAVSDLGRWNDEASSASPSACR